MSNQRMDDPIIYASDLNENSTRYDYPRAWPDETTLKIQFTVLAVVNAIVATCCLIFIVAFLRSKNCLSNPFNLYLLYIAIPDFLVSFFCLITCSMSATISQYYSEAMCGFQAFYLCWSFASNAWLNGVITYQVHKLLRDSHVRRHYITPTHKMVTIHALCVYLYAAFWGFINSSNIPWLPHESHLYYGFACHGMEYDKPSSIFFWLVFIPLYMGIPLTYACYVIWDIWKRQLLPPMGRRRNLSLFLLRLVFLYFMIWFPYLLLSLVGNFAVVNAWLLWSGAVASHFQGLISVLFCMTNNDMRQAVKDFLTCQPIDTSSSHGSSRFRMSGLYSSMKRSWFRHRPSTAITSSTSRRCNLNGNDEKSTKPNGTTKEQSNTQIRNNSVFEFGGDIIEEVTSFFFLAPPKNNNAAATINDSESQANDNTVDIDIDIEQPKDMIDEDVNIFVSQDYSPSMKPSVEESDDDDHHIQQQRQQVDARGEAAAEEEEATEDTEGTINIGESIYDVEQQQQQQQQPVDMNGDNDIQVRKEFNATVALSTVQQSQQNPGGRRPAQ